MTRQKSSAYNNRTDDLACFLSLTYITKNRGPTIDPWETPHEIFEKLEYCWILNAWSITYELNQLTVSSQNLIEFNFSKSIFWLIVSKAFWRSNSIIAVRRKLSRPFKLLSFKDEWHKPVKSFVLKLDWYLYNILYCLYSQ